MKNFTEFKKDIERDLMLQIIMHMKRHTLTTKKAQKLAQEFLPTLKNSTIETFLDDLSKLSYNYKEIRDVFMKYAQQYEDTIVTERLEKMSHLIAENDIEKAVQVGRGQA